MDPSSIITQVKEDGIESTEKDPTPANASSVATELPPIRGWRRRYGRLLRSLLCCVGGGEGCARRRDLLYRAAGGGASSSRPLLPPARPADAHRVCAVVDLDETLVHSSFQPVRNADFVIPVEIDGVTHSVYVLKRPHVDEFLTRMNQMFECVLFTASISKYADPVVDLLDPAGVFGARLFRDACAVHRSNFVKDLAKLGRALNRVVIVDNSPNSYIFHPNNAVAVSSWFGATDDVELLTCLPILERISTANDVYDILGHPSRHGNHAVPQPPAPALSPSPVSYDALSQPAAEIT